MTALALAAGCTSAQPPPERPALKAADLAAPVRAAPLLHWTGSWRGPIESFDPVKRPAPDNRVEADLRAMGNGAVFGTVTIDGATATVLRLDDKTQFVKADARYWRLVGHAALPLRDFAGQWVAEWNHLLYGLDLARLSPQRVAADLAEIETPAATGTAAPPMPAVPTWVAPPTDRPVAYPPPDGVPAGAPHLDLTRLDTSSTDAVRNGTYWFSPEAPHRLLGYSGVELLTNLGLAPEAAARLTVRTGTAQEAADAYADLAARLRGIPRTVTVNTTALLDQEVSQITPCAPGVCGPVAVGLRLTNDSEKLTIGERIDVTLYGGDFWMPDRITDKVGTCRVSVGRLAPGKSVRKVCVVEDPRIQRMQREDKHVWFRAETSATLTSVTTPSRAEQRARELPAH
ncbi:hypothetical protein [[Actinomadura] parvosata]|uniref:hypothetical protein n=1 Tax=[Actinomadura] parvosata TaxID=1955412 RepID=UPI0012BCB2C3|nr:hypothetical protein [Nonomuraea sp. ATCC 55076]